MNLNKNVFREYDVRGIADTDFKGDFPYKLGQAFAIYIIKNKKGKNIAVSGDVRLSTDRLKKDFIKGVLSVGLDVVDIGTVPTPINYFSNYCSDIKVDGSVQITGSHNPSEYNGFKFTLQKKPFFAGEIQQLYNIMISHNNDESSDEILEGRGVLKDIIPIYINDIIGRIKINRKMRVIMDCGNAAGAIVAPQIFKKLGIEIKELYCDIDGTFPNHHPDPTVDSNLNKIIQEIKDDGDFDLGVAYDGDADRVVCVDSKGNIIRSDILMCIFIQNILNKTDNKKIVYDVKCSSAIKDVIIRSGGEPIEWKTGHSLIKNKMILEKSKFGGELSGHIFFADNYYGYDDAIYVSLRLIEVLSASNESLNDLVQSIPKYISTPELRFECKTDKIKFSIIKDLENYFKEKYPCSMIDGIKIFIDEGWGLLRASNTQPVIVCRVEAKSDKELNQIKSMILSKLAEYRGIKVEF